MMGFKPKLYRLLYHYKWLNRLFYTNDLLVKSIQLVHFYKTTLFFGFLYKQPINTFIKDSMGWLIDWFCTKNDEISVMFFLFRIIWSNRSTFGIVWIRSPFGHNVSTTGRVRSTGGQFGGRKGTNFKIINLRNKY